MILFFKNGFLIHQVDSMNVIVNIRTSSLPVNSRLDGPCLKTLKLLFMTNRTRGIPDCKEKVVDDILENVLGEDPEV